MKLFEIPMLAMSFLGLGLLSGLDSSVAYADFTFGEPVNLGSAINSTALERAPKLSQDGLCLYFYEDTANGTVNWMATRATPNDPWDTPVNLGVVITEDDHPAVFKPFKVVPSFTTGDGLEIYLIWYSSAGDMDIWMMKRETIDGDWGPPANLGPVVNSSTDEGRAAISSDGLELYFSGGARSDGPGGYGDADLWVTKRSTRSAPWGKPENLGPVVNSAYWDGRAYLSPDGLTLVFNSQRPGGYGQQDLYLTRRATRSDPWGVPVNLGPLVNSPASEEYPYLSPDGSTLYFHSDRPGGYGSSDIWQAPIIPIVDFNGDGKVDGKEVLAMAQNWGQSKSAYDIGLSPTGDGVVDVNDLIVLAGYIGQDVNDPSLIAHWALDETEGMTAADSAGENDAMVLGNAAWQPEGKIGGALAFNGTAGFARSSSLVLDPAQGPLSVIAWVKGGATGRVIVSQASGADWLYLNQYGMLTTDLKASGTNGKSLTSSAFVLDDQWHRVVLTWDGTNRALHMDGIEVARDTQPSLTASSGDLHIGGGKNLGTSTFWSGLIDDVRIYNRAVKP